METLKTITYKLSEETRLEDIIIWGDIYAMHITGQEEVAITDHSDYSKLLAIMSRDFYNLLVNGEKI